MSGDISGPPKVAVADAPMTIDSSRAHYRGRGELDLSNQAVISSVSKI